MSDNIQHSGVKGMRWGVRRYMDENGKLTDLGKKRAAELERDQKAKIESKKSRQEYRQESKKSKQNYRQERELRDQSVVHDAARRRGRIAAAAALAIIGTMAAKTVINNVRANRIKLGNADTANKIKLGQASGLQERKNLLAKNWTSYTGVGTTAGQFKQIRKTQKGLL